MQEEVTQKTIAFVVRATKLTADVLRRAMSAYLSQQKHKAQELQKRQGKEKQPEHGKISVKELMGKDQGANTLEITEKNIRSFERVAKKYNVDFAVKKDRTVSPPKYLVFFKGRDADVIASAFREFVFGNEKKKARPSVRRKLARQKKRMEKRENRQREKQKDRDRGQSL